MTSEDLRSELEKQPFTPLRLHLVSGYSIEVKAAADATMLQNAILIMHNPDPRFEEAGYDVVALRNIERIEQIRSATREAKQEAL